MNTPRGWLPLIGCTAPADESGVVDAVRSALADDTPLYPIGGGTAIRSGVRPGRPGRGLLLAGLSRIVDHALRDLTITVGAGLPLSDLMERLEAAGQWLPIDMPLISRATVGGAVAVAPSGPRRARHGTLRDYVIGLRAVDGHGEVFRSGGRVVKNVAGLDLCRLLTGSMGTLSVITEVTLLVKPRPPSRVLVTAPVHAVDRGLTLATLLSGWSPLPTVGELLVGPAFAGFPGLPQAGSSRAVWLAVGFEGEPEETDDALRRFEEQSRTEGLSPTIVRDGEADLLLRSLTDFPAPDQDQTVVQIDALPTGTAAAARAVLEVDPGSSMSLRLLAGGLVARLSPAADPSALERLRAALVPTSTRMVVRHHSPSAALDRAAVWGPGRPEERLMRRVKDRFDPKGIFNPGRFVFEER
jgi:glycolate oxidase FAD binding subunit